MRAARVPRAVPRALVLVAAGALFALAAFSSPVFVAAGPAAPSPTSAAVTTATRVCPSPGLPGAQGGGVGLIAATSANGAGTAEVTRLAGPGSGARLLRVARPAALSISGVRPARSAASHAAAAKANGQTPASAPASGGVVVRAHGAMAQGLEVEQTTGHDVATSRCASPGTDFWFVGPGQHAVAHIDVYLMNAGSQAADVNIQIFTDAGPLAGSADTGVSVPPHGMVRQSLAPTVHDSRALALHVRTSVGQVAAAVRESATAGGYGAWLPPCAAPAADVVVPGLPATSGARSVYVAVPGERGAHVKLEAVTSRGSYEPTGGSGVDLPGGSATAISLPSMSGVPGALKIVSNVPVTASVMAPGGADGAPGVFTAASSPVQGQGVVADSLSGSGEASSLVLSAPGGSATVRVAEVAQAGAAASTAGPASRVTRIAAGHSRVLQLGPSSQSHHLAAFAVVIRPAPGSGPVYAGRVVVSAGSSGAAVALLPVACAPAAVSLPPVRAAVVTTTP